MFRRTALELELVSEIVGAHSTWRAKFFGSRFEAHRKRAGAVVRDAEGGAAHRGGA
jgi:hypothetical protein